MGSVSLSGAGSTNSGVNLVNGGLDVLGIVDNLIAAAGVPITRLQQKTKSNQDKIAAYQAFNSKLLALKTSAENLLFHGKTVPLSMPTSFSDRLSASLFSARKATSSNAGVVTASAGDGLATGNFTVTVSGLAKFNSYASNNFASGTDTETKTGTLWIQKGAGESVAITIDDTNNTLQGIKSAINSADAGVTATILNDGSGTPYRLVITSADSGSAGELTITNELQTGTGSAVTLGKTTPADDAAFQINGIDLTSSSNTVTNAVEGMTFTLMAASGTAFIHIDRDTDAIVAGVKDLVAKYNDVVSNISSQSAYNATTKSAGLLAGDFTLRATQGRLSSALSQMIDSDGSSLTVLSQIGVKLGNNGTLSVDETKLRDALSTHFTDTAHLLLADAPDGLGGTVSIIPGLENQLKGLTDSIDGPVVHATDALQQGISRINDQIRQMQDRLDVQRELLIEQFSRADQALRQLSVLQTSLSSQISALGSL